jgi:HlyD family secretion protein/adhesin transport system membrane fusion protein
MKRNDDTLQNLGEFLTLPPALNEHRQHQIYGPLIYLLGVLICGIVAWSAVAKIRELAVASGEIVSSSFVQPVHHLEGGIVEEVFVAEGDAVKRGAPLMRLRPYGAESDLAQLQARSAQLTLQQMRLNAALQGAVPDFGTLGNAFPALAREQLELFERTEASAASEREKLELEIVQASGEVESLHLQLESFKRQADIESEQTGIRKTSFDRGYTSRLAYLEAKSKFEAAQARISEVAGQIFKVEKKADEAVARLKQAVAERLQKFADERAKAAGELAEVTQTLGKHKDRVERLVVAAPVDGVINLMAQKSPGVVLKPGDLVAEIVSLESGVIAEVHLKAKDLGHVDLGDDAEIRVTNFDPNVTGYAHGSVVEISPTTFKDQQGVPYYRTRVRLKDDRLKQGQRTWQLQPGMVVEANIIIGSRSLFQYMLKPVYRSLDTMFSEQ